MADIEVIDSANVELVVEGEAVDLLIEATTVELFVEEYGIQVPNAETVYATTNSSLDRANGGLQALTLTGNSKLSAALFNGQSITVMIDLKGFTLDITDFTPETTFMLDPNYKNLVCIFNLLGVNYLVASGRFGGI